MHEIVRRKAERLCICRGCDKSIDKGDDIIYTYSIRNRGQNIMFCIACALMIGELCKTDHESGVL